jgi:hypothetical protein
MTIDPILTNVNAAADRRLMNDVLNAPDPFDGGCPADCGGDFGGDSGGDFGGKPANPMDALTRNDRHLVGMCMVSYGHGYLAGVRAMVKAIERLDLPRPHSVDVLLAKMAVVANNGEAEKAEHQAFLVRLHTRGSAK